MSVALNMPYSSTNRVLSQLPGTVLCAMRPFLSRVRLIAGQVLIEDGGATEHVFFPEIGIVSLMAGTTDARSGVQVAMIGREGLVGALALLAPTAPSCVNAVSQVAGAALRIRLTDLRRLCDQHAALREACLLFTYGLTMQAMQTAAVNAHGSLATRFVRWLLMTNERVDGAEIYMTHKAVSLILGVRRAGVTIIADLLQQEGLIRVSRGRTTILDRAGLERRAGKSAGCRETEQSRQAA